MFIISLPPTLMMVKEYFSTINSIYQIPLASPLIITKTKEDILINKNITLKGNQLLLFEILRSPFSNILT